MGFGRGRRPHVTKRTLILSDHGFAIRRLRADDAELYRAIRLEGLENEPEAFASTAAMESGQAIAWLANRIEKRIVLAATEGGALWAWPGSTF